VISDRVGDGGRVCGCVGGGVCECVGMWVCGEEEKRNCERRERREKGEEISPPSQRALRAHCGGQALLKGAARPLWRAGGGHLPAVSALVAQPQALQAGGGHGGGRE
jgi:hypothetical protein